jgi:hypothetical protein
LVLSGTEDSAMIINPFIKRYKKNNPMEIKKKILKIVPIIPRQPNPNSPMIMIRMRVLDPILFILVRRFF